MTDRGPSHLFSLKNLSGNPRLAVYTIHDKCLKTHVQTLLYLSPIKRYGMHHTLFKNKQTSIKRVMMNSSVFLLKKATSVLK